MSEDRRHSDGRPPTIITQAYNDLSQQDRDEMQRNGYRMIAVAILPALALGIFFPIPLAYWIFAAAVGATGLGLVFPAFAVWLIDLVLKFLTTALPVLQGWVRPDRRG